MHAVAQLAPPGTPYVSIAVLSRHTLLKFGNSRLCSSTSSEGKATLPDKHARSIASFPGLPCFSSSVCVQYNARKRKSAKNGEGLVSFITWVTSGGHDGGRDNDVRLLGRTCIAPKHTRTHESSIRAQLYNRMMIRRFYSGPSEWAKFRELGPTRSSFYLNEQLVPSPLLAISNDVIRCEVLPPNLNSSNIFPARFWGQTVKFKDCQYFRLYNI